MNKEKIGILYAIAASCCYGIISILTKMTTEVPSIVLAFLRSLICLIIILPILLKNGIYIPKKKSLIFFRMLFGFLYLICFYYAAKNLFFLIDAIALANTGNLFVPLVLFFGYGKKIPIKRLIFIIFGFLGIILVLKPSFNCINIAGIAGLLSGLFLAITKVLLRKLSQEESLYTIIFYVFLGNTLISIGPTIFYWQPLNNHIMWLYIVLIGILTFLFQFLNTKAYSKTPASKLSSIFYSTILFSGFFEWIIFSKIPDLRTVLGAILIITAGILTFKEEDKKETIKTS